MSARAKVCDWCGGKIERHDHEDGSTIFSCRDCKWIFGSVIPILGLALPENTPVIQYPRYRNEEDHFCRNCETHSAIKMIHEMEEDKWWERVECACGWSKVVRDDYCPQFVGKEKWPQRDKVL